MHTLQGQQSGAVGNQADFFFKKAKDRLTKEMYPMALAKNSLDDAVDLARTTRAMNISTTFKHW